MKNLVARARVLPRCALDWRLRSTRVQNEQFEHPISLAGYKSAVPLLSNDLAVGRMQKDWCDGQWLDCSFQLHPQALVLSSREHTPLAVCLKQEAERVSKSDEEYPSRSLANILCRVKEREVKGCLV